MRGSIPLSSAKLNNMNKYDKLMRDIKKEMSMVKGGDFLEWYDSLDAIEKAQYKVEFSKLQESYVVPHSSLTFNEILDDHKDQFVKDLVQGRIEQAIKDVSEWADEGIIEDIQEAMAKHDVIPYNEDDLGMDIDKFEKRFDAIYKTVIYKLYTKAFNDKEN